MEALEVFVASRDGEASAGGATCCFGSALRAVGASVSVPLTMVAVSAPGTFPASPSVAAAAVDPPASRAACSAPTRAALRAGEGG